MQILKA